MQIFPSTLESANDVVKFHTTKHAEEERKRNNKLSKPEITENSETGKICVATMTTKMH